MSKESIILIGGGGHCKSVLDSVKSMGLFGSIVITDPGLEIGTEILGCKIIGSDAVLMEYYENGYVNAFITVGSIDSTTRRVKIYGDTVDIGFKYPNIYDASATIARDTLFGKGIYVGKKAVVNSGAKIDDFAIINTGSIVEHDCEIGCYTHISVSAVICGGARIGDNTFIGANATIIQKVMVGNDCIIGAGAIVLADVPNNTKVVGVWKGL